MPRKYRPFDVDQHKDDLLAILREVIANPESVDDLQRKMKVRGKVDRLELYGAFIDIGVDMPALIHISKLSKGHVNRVSDVLNVGDEVEVWIDRVEPEQGQIMVTMVEPLAVEWGDLKQGQEYTGKVTRLENFGAFVDIGVKQDGLVHISQLADRFISNPNDVVKLHQHVQVKVLEVDVARKRIQLTMKDV